MAVGCEDLHFFITEYNSHEVLFLVKDYLKALLFFYGCLLLLWYYSLSSRGTIASSCLEGLEHILG